MKILPKYKIHEVADEKIIMIQGAQPGDMTTVLGLNETSLYLWTQLYGRTFEIDDVVRLLTDRYDVDEATAREDAAKWIAELSKHNIFE